MDGLAYSVYLGVSEPVHHPQGPGVEEGGVYEVLLALHCSLASSNLLLATTTKAGGGLEGLWITGTSPHLSSGGEGGRRAVRGRVLVVRREGVTLGCSGSHIA